VHGQDFEASVNPGIRKNSYIQPELQQLKGQEDMQILLSRAKKCEPQIIKMQASFRGYLQRKNNKIPLREQPPLPQAHIQHVGNYKVDAIPQSSNRSLSIEPGAKMMEEKGKALLNGNSYARELSSMPENLNPLVKAVYEKLDSFNWQT